MSFYFVGFLSIVGVPESEKYLLTLNNKMAAETIIKDESIMQSFLKRTPVYIFMK